MLACLCGVLLFIMQLPLWVSSKRVSRAGPAAVVQPGCRVRLAHPAPCPPPCCSIRGCTLHDVTLCCGSWRPTWRRSCRRARCARLRKWTRPWRGSSHCPLPGTSSPSSSAACWHSGAFDPNLKCVLRPSTLDCDPKAESPGTVQMAHQSLIGHCCSVAHHHDGQTTSGHACLWGAPGQSMKRSGRGTNKQSASTCVYFTS